MLNLRKEDTNLSIEEGSGEFSIKPIAAHFHKLPYGIHIGVGEAQYQSKYGVLGLKIVPIL